MIADIAVVMPAAGSGSRFGAGDKLRAELWGRTVLQRSVALFAVRKDVSQIVIPTTPDRFDVYREHLAGIVAAERLVLVAGGRERWESVLFGLRVVGPEVAIVAIHDAARPLTPAEVIDAAIAGAREVGGSVPVVAEPATLKRVGPDGMIGATVDRKGLFQAQTPQCFSRDKLLEAFERMAAQNLLAGVTDDAQVFERAGIKVLATPGNARNIKITTADDVTLAQGILAGIHR